MKFGMLGCGVRRKTLIESSLAEGIWLMSTKLGAPELGPGFGEAALIRWQALRTLSASCWPTEGSTDCALDAVTPNDIWAGIRKPIEPKSIAAIVRLVIALHLVPNHLLLLAKPINRN